MPTEEYSPVPVAAAGQIALQYAKDVVAIFSIDRAWNRTHITTYGKSAEDKCVAATVGGAIATTLAGGLDHATTFEDFRVLGAELELLAKDQAAWSQTTFGQDSERGPLMGLKHLAMEAKEAEQAAQEVALFAMADLKIGNGRDIALKLAEELADCFLLILDVSRRSGLLPIDLVRAAAAKQGVNKTRKWPTPQPDVPCEHIPEGQ